MKAAVLILVGILIAAAGAFGGYTFRTRQVVNTPLQQPGWCCIKTRQVCLAVNDMEACRAQKGTVFNWDPDVCTSLCAGR